VPQQTSDNKTATMNTNTYTNSITQQDYLPQTSSTDNSH